MKVSAKTGFFAGSVGAIILVAIMYILQAAGQGEPGFIGMYRGMMGDKGVNGEIIGAILFILSGGIWGVLFALLVKNPTALKGFIFGILPSLWLWIAVNAALHKPLFNNFEMKGIIFPLIFNMVIWGSFTGWYCSKKKPPAEAY